MPKILDSVRAQLLAAARAQIEENGYAGTTIRSVAAACGIAVGTVYNYFSSKEYLIAAYVAEDWGNSLTAMRAGSGADPETCLRVIHDELAAFAARHRRLFSDPDAAKTVSGAFLSRHLQLRGQIASLIGPLVPSEDGFPAHFIAEALLTWTLSGVPFERIYDMLKKLLPDSPARKEETHEQL